MIQLVLNEVHEKLGAKIVPFAGFAMPVQYEGVVKEHINVREKVGMFDVSHMGEFLVEGKDAEAFLQYVVSNNIQKLTDGKILYGYLPNTNGGIVDDLLVYRYNAQKFMLVVNASNIQKDWDWIHQFKKGEVKITNLSNETCLFALQGPLAIKALQKLTTYPLDTIVYYNFVECEVDGVKVIVSATGYTGAGGFEIYVPNASAIQIWNAIMRAGEEYGILPIGLAARDTLRLEKGFCLYGNDIDDTTSPVSAGLLWVTDLNKDFVGKDIIAAHKLNGVKDKLIGFVLEEKGIPRSGYELVNEKDEVIGKVTSGTSSPSLNLGIGMGYVNSEYAKIQTQIFVKIRNKNLLAKVVKLPFL
jgi:aminomethyltransferase